MKKISKLLIALVITFLGINVVKADNCENVKMTAEVNSDGSPFIRDAIKMRFGSVLEGRMLTLKDSNGREIPSYCHNVSKPTGAEYGSTTFNCRREIFDSTTSLVTTDIRNVYDAGLIKILATGYRVNNTGAGVQEYTATDLAVKTYELLWPSNINSNNMNSGTEKDYLRAYHSFANKMLSDQTIQDKLKSAAGSVRNKYNEISYSWAQNGAAIENRAKELILLGLDEAIRFKANGAASLTWNSNPSVTREISTDGNYSASLSYTFRLDGFTSSNALANVKFSCANCQANGVSYSVSVNNEDLGQGYSNAIDLLSKVNNGSGEVTVTVKFNANSRTYGCEALDYKFDLNYKDDSISNEAYEMYSSHRSCVANACQPIYSLRNTNVTKTSTIEDNFSLCNVTCEELEAKCNAGNSKACQEKNKQYPNGCVNCGVGIKNNVCADPGETSSIDLIEGYSIDAKTCTQSNEANITGCILGKNAKDPAGNSYVYMDNGVCRVSCKEDFHFNLPGNINVGSGRYFTLKTDIKATKTCYLDIYAGDPSSVLSRFDAGAKTTQENYCECASAKEIEKLTVNDFRESGSSTEKCTTYVDESKTIYGNEYDNLTTCLENNNYVLSKCRKLTKIVKSQRTINIDVPSYIAEYTYDKGCSSCSGSGTIIAIPTFESSTCNVQSKEEAVRAKLEEYKNISKAACEKNTELTSRASVHTYNISGIGDIKPYVYSGTYTVSTGGSRESIYNGLGAYNACALWDMSYDFNPDMYFDYEESYSNNAITHKLDLVGSIKQESTTQYYCRSNDKDNAYESCSSGWKTEPIFASHSVCVCDADKCENQPIAYNDTRRMKKSISYSASYTTPTQFYQIYPTGEIVVAKTGDKIENSKELTNALPVGLGTPQGRHHYALYAKNLGEYFGTGKFGRVWGNSNSVVSATLKSQEKCITDGALRYDTEIDKRYIDKGVWVCDYNVNTGNSCVKTIDENGTTTYHDKNGNITDAFTYDRECVCPDCPVTCDPNGCYRSDCPECPVTCPTCLYSNGKNFVFRSISLNNLNPNNRDLGANWRYDDKQISTALEMKAKLTTDEIITDGETIYDDSTNKYVMKMTMDSAMINKIKARKDKNYTSNTLECYDYTQDGKTYKNIFCYSKLTDELLSDSKTKDKIKFSVNRPFSEAERKNSQNSEYWTTWTKKLESSKWNVNTVREISYFKQYDQEIGIGPSWK